MPQHGRTSPGRSPRSSPSLTADDTLLVVLLGHGTFDGTSAKFNLVGPDMDSNEWKAALDGNPARLVFVNTTSSSFQFVPALAGKNRIIIAATDSAAQKYATVFPQYFIEALDQIAKADNDKNGRLSVWEAFTYAGQAVKQSFDQKGTLVTERSIIDDGIERRAGARRRFWILPPAATAANAAVAGLEKRRIAIEAEIEQLKGARARCPPASTRKSSSASRSSSPRSPRRSDQLSNFQSQRKDAARDLFKKNSAPWRLCVEMTGHVHWLRAGLRKREHASMPARNPATCAQNATPPVCTPRPPRSIRRR